MSIRQDYLMRQIERIAKLLASLVFKKADHKQEIQIEQALSELTGLNASWFSDPNKAQLLGTMLEMLPEDDQKALAARLLSHNGPVYSAIGSKLNEQIDPKKLSPHIKSLLGP